MRSDDRSPTCGSDRDRHRFRIGFDRIGRFATDDRPGTRTDSSPEKGPHVGDDRTRTNPPVHWAVLLAPLVLTSIYGLAATIFGPSLFDTEASGPAAFGLLGLLLLVAGWSTARLYDDASWCAEQPLEWNPSPWTYIVGGALVLLGYRLFLLVVSETAVDQPGLYLVGNLVVALALSSIVAGPLYALQRRRHA